MLVPSLAALFLDVTLSARPGGQLPDLVPAQSAAAIRGLVVDAQSGAPLPGAEVSIENGASVTTAADGTFVLEDLPAGTIRLRVSLIGYGFVQRSLELIPGTRASLTIPLSQGAAAYTESVTVSGDRFRPDDGVASTHALGSADLQNLRGVLTDDALRAVQVMPGVTTGDDFRSEFSVRSSDFSHLNFTVDGFATPYLMHMVRGVEERANTGSVSMINSDVLESVTLSNGGYPQRSGNRTGAELQFVVREGSRDRRMLRASVSGTAASITAEGPVGRSRRGSWLVSARKSYLDLILKKLREEGLSFSFADAQAKVRYDIGSRHSAAVTFVTGDSRLRELPQQAVDDDLFFGDNASAILIASWRSAWRRGTVTAGALAAANRFRNHILTGVNREQGSNDQLAARADLVLPLARHLTFETGVLAERAAEFQRKQRINGAAVTVLNDYRSGAARQGLYARLRLDAGRRVMVAPGARVDHSHLTGQRTTSPWVQSEVTLRDGLVLKAGSGVYRQFPAVDQVVGAFRGIDLGPEASTHVDVGLEQRVSSSTRLQLALYRRDDRDVIRRPGAETRVELGGLVRGTATAPYETRLDGYARGVELLVQRSAATGLSGWVSYAFGENRYTDRVSGETYWGDLDQRHTLNAYFFYRFSHRFSGSVKYRTGSNFPIPGYYARDGDRYFVGAERNALRLPVYGRLDIRANRSFSWSSRRLTLFAEVINVLNQDNVRFNPPRVSTATRQVTRLFDSLVPVVPSAGVLIEF